MSRSPVRWYIKAQLGVLLLPVGLCLFGEAISRKVVQMLGKDGGPWFCLLYTSPSPRDLSTSRMPSSA